MNITINLDLSEILELEILTQKLFIICFEANDKDTMLLLLDFSVKLAKLRLTSAKKKTLKINIIIIKFIINSFSNENYKISSYQLNLLQKINALISAFINKIHFAAITPVEFN